MLISVIIPVYNAEKYVESAVESALQQKECGEVILVEDQSLDNALEVCKVLTKRHEKVKLYQHEDGKNHGAGISRNLGIKKAQYDYIAFLDADDFYMPNRFAKAGKILSQDSSIDGVYEAVGSEFENEEARRRYFATHATEIATITEPLKPEILFYYLVVGGAGYFHLDGLTVTKNALLRVGMFPSLRLHQDSMLGIKLAAICTLVSGEIKMPVALRRLHADNRITDLKTDFNYTRFLMYAELRNWLKEKNISNDKQDLVNRLFYRNKYLQARKERKILTAISAYLMKRIFERKVSRSNCH